MMITIAILCWMVQRKKKNLKFEEADNIDAVQVAPSSNERMGGPAELNAVYRNTVRCAELDPQGRQIPVELDTRTRTEKF